MDPGLRRDDGLVRAEKLRVLRDFVGDFRLPIESRKGAR
jgi:hypothetical protein